MALHKPSPRSSELVSFVLERNFDLRGRDEAGYTTLHLAAVINEPNLVRKLLDYGVDPNTKPLRALQHCRLR